MDCVAPPSSNPSVSSSRFLVAKGGDCLFRPLAMGLTPQVQRPWQRCRAAIGRHWSTYHRGQDRWLAACSCSGGCCCFVFGHQPKTPGSYLSVAGVCIAERSSAIKETDTVHSLEQGGRKVMLGWVNGVFGTAVLKTVTVTVTATAAVAALAIVIHGPEA